MKKYSKQDQQLPAVWATDCAEHVLPIFQKAYPIDDRPRKAIETCRTWIQTDKFKMSEIEALLCPLMQPPEKPKKTMQPVLQRVPQVKRLQQHMLPDTPSVPLTTPSKQLRKLTISMPRQKLLKSAIGNRSIFRKV